MELAGIKHIRGSDKYKEYLEQELLQLRKNGVALRVLPKKVSENEGTDIYMYGCLIANVSTLYQCKKFVRYNLQVQHTSYFLNLQSFQHVQMFADPLFQIKLHQLNTVLLTGFQSSPRELWNPLSKAVPGKFHWSGGHSKCNCLQDRGNFYRSRVWQIVLIFNKLLLFYGSHFWGAFSWLWYLAFLHRGT